MGNEWQLLVSLAWSRAVVGVVRDRAGEAWLTGDVEHGASTSIKPFRPAIAGAEAGTVVGGLLPPGAVACEVLTRGRDWQTAAASGGAWVAVLDEPVRGQVPVARYLDGKGRIVRAPLPEGVVAEAVADAVSECPACAQIAWQRITRAPEGRYSSDFAGNPTAAACGACGYEENLGVLVGLRTHVAAETGEEDGHAEDVLARAPARKRADDLAAAVARLGFTVYELAGWSGERGLSAYGGSSAGPDRPLTRVDDVTLRFGERGRSPEWADITSDASHSRWTDDQAAFEALERLLDDFGEWPSLSPTAVSLWLNAKKRDARTGAAHAELRTQTIRVDGRDVAFTGRSAG